MWFISVSDPRLCFDSLKQVQCNLVWMVVRAAEGTGLENQRAATPSRGFKSPTIRCCPESRHH